MQNIVVTNRILRRGEIAGMICFVALFVDYLAVFIFGAGKSALGDGLQLVIYLIVCATYYIFLLGIRETIISISSSDDLRRMQAFLNITIISCLLMAPLTAPIFIPNSLEFFVDLLAILLVTITGIASIRVAGVFEKIESDRTVYGKKAAKWLKISGWLMATVILGALGLIASLLADYYLWRLVKEERLRSSVA